MAATRAHVLNVARGELGYVETPVNLTRYGAWYGLNGQPWCAIWVSWVAGHARAGDIIPRHAYTPSGAAWFQAKGRWHTSGPKAGDVVYFRFPMIGPDRINHVGFVESIRPDGYLITLEANTSDGPGGSQRDGGGVRRRVRSPSAYVAGYGRPAYTATVARPTLGRVLRQGNTGGEVRRVQRLVGLTGGQVDGISGPRTERAVKTWQARHHLAADGVFGPRSCKAAGWRWTG